MTLQLAVIPPAVHVAPVPTLLTEQKPAAVAVHVPLPEVEQCPVEPDCTEQVVEDVELLDALQNPSPPLLHWLLLPPPPVTEQVSVPFPVPASALQFPAPPPEPAEVPVEHDRSADPLELVEQLAVPPVELPCALQDVVVVPRVLHDPPPLGVPAAEHGLGLDDAEAEHAPPLPGLPAVEESLLSSMAS